MGARTKLNEAHIGGSIVIGLIVHLLTGSWILGGAVMAVLIFSAMDKGNIRMRPGLRQNGVRR